MCSLFSIRNRLLGTCLLLGLVPTCVLAWMGLRMANDLVEQAASEYEVIAQGLTESIDRNLFERYGDVQAFGLNAVVRDSTTWTETEGRERIVETMNQYVDTYDVYYLTMLVDDAGRVVAVNDRNEKGEPIDTHSLVGVEVSQETWFQDAMNGRYLSSADGAISGTVVEDLRVDPVVQQIFHDEGLVLGFAAPVRDQSGKVIGVWRNLAKFSLVEEIFESAYRSFRETGRPAIEFTMLNSQGQLLLSFDPQGSGTERVVRDMSAILVENLVTDGEEVAVAARLVPSGHRSDAWHSQKQTRQLAGFAKTDGALGFPGLQWIVMTRTNPNDALPGLSAIRRAYWTVVALTLVVVVATAVFVAQAMVLPIRRTILALQRIAEGDGDLTLRLEEQAANEMGELGHWFNLFVHRVEQIMHKILANSVSVEAASGRIRETASGLSDGIDNAKHDVMSIATSARQLTDNFQSVASAAVQMSATSRHVQSMTEQVSEGISRVATNTERASQVTAEATRLTEASCRQIDELRQCAQEIGKVIDVIQDIAEQTNLLALNATIESARAGEYGKGFAVVASEVKDLAKQTAEATDGIRHRISAIQVSSQSAVEAMDRIKHVIDDVNSLATEIAGTVEQQRSSTSDIARDMSDMTAAVEELAENISVSSDASLTISAGITRVSEQASGFAVNATQTNYEGEQLCHVAKDLSSIVSQFRVSAVELAP